MYIKDKGQGKVTMDMVKAKPSLGLFNKSIFIGMSQLGGKRGLEANGSFLNILL